MFLCLPEYLITCISSDSGHRLVHTAGWPHLLLGGYFSTWRRQLLSFLNLLWHINYARIKLRPTLNYFYLFLHFAVGRFFCLFVFFLEQLHILVNFVFFPLVFFSVEFSHYFFPIISFYSQFHFRTSVPFRMVPYLLSACMCHSH